MEVCRKGNLPNEPRIPALRASMGRMTAAIQAALPAVAGSENGYVRIRANHFPNRTAAATAPTSPQITGKSDQMVFNTAAVSFFGNTENENVKLAAVKRRSKTSCLWLRRKRLIRVILIIQPEYARMLPLFWI